MIFIILALILISFIFAPLGCMVLWKRHVYFGDGLAHASLLAGSISAVVSLPIIYSGVIVALIFAGLVFIFKNHSGNNAVINLVSSFMLSSALIINYLYPSQVNISSLLFGDVLLVSLQDLLILFAIVILTFFFIKHFYNQILLIIINRDIAMINKVKVKVIELGFLILLSLAIFITIKIVGALMVTALLLVPAMIARFMSYTPVQMMIRSVITALSMNLIGIIIAYFLDLPVTPVIVMIGITFYILFYAKNRLLHSSLG